MVFNRLYLGDLKHSITLWHLSRPCLEIPSSEQDYYRVAIVRHYRRTAIITAVTASLIWTFLQWRVVIQSISAIHIPHVIVMTPSWSEWTGWHHFFNLEGVLCRRLHIGLGYSSVLFIYLFVIQEKGQFQWNCLWSTVFFTPDVWWNDGHSS